MRRLLVLVVVAVAALALSAPAYAEHQHWIQTPAGCKEDIAKGQTRKSDDHPGGHKFHNNVHVGTPGQHAFERPNNPVTVGKDECP